MVSGLLLDEVPLGKPAIVPARKGAWTRRFGGGGAGGDVGLFGWEDWPRFGRDEMKDDEELETVN